ncbi:papilin-like isoform X2 [Pocillopora damicornis]|uniref:papilin-like isoform X2 n=1 Tax=Pocillopora damicornis TaxID=46731 RepID=UPI000F5537CC|nr:papilin-like isoform X2 [Pocillopora damicornis]
MNQYGRFIIISISPVACRDSITTPVCQHFVQTYRDSCKWPEMKTSCPLTCKFCVPPPRCATKASRYGCCWDKKTEAKSYAGDGCPECRDQFPSYCRERIARHPRKSACNKNGSKMCPKSCGVCEHKAAAAQAPPECLYSHYGCCWDLTSAQGPVGEGCVACRDRLRTRACKNLLRNYRLKGIEGCKWKSVKSICALTCNSCVVKPKCALETSKYGCCWDKKTEAKGFYGEGCPA